jgi:tetratricopeptide (TPR) repeat protein
VKRLALLGFALGALSCASPAAQPAPTPPPPESAAPPAVELEARKPELEFLLAQRLEQDGKLDEAYEAYVRALDGDAQNASLLKHLAELAFRLDKQTEAREFAERAVASKSDDAWLRLFLGESYRADGDVARMEGVLTSATGEPLSSDAAAVLYQAWLQSGELEKAGRVARWQTEAEPDVPAGWLNLAEIREQRGDVAGAEKILREADLRIPGALDFLAAIANSRRGRGDRLGE